MCTAQIGQLPVYLWRGIRVRQTWMMFAVAVLLVSIPVFFQAPLVRVLPWMSLVLTGAWLGLSQVLQKRESTQVWGDLLMGFTWTWLAGSLYWGWLRWEPLLHLPVEAIGLPFALLCLRRQSGHVGHWFYLGSLFGTAMTDTYFYIVDLIPHWRNIMQVDPALARPIFQSAAAQIHTAWGMGWAVCLILILLIVGCIPLRYQELHWWTFGGAVLSTVLVDGLFWIAATAA